MKFIFKHWDIDYPEKDNHLKTVCKLDLPDSISIYGEMSSLYLWNAITGDSITIHLSDLPKRIDHDKYSNCLWIHNRPDHDLPDKPYTLLPQGEGESIVVYKETGGNH